MKVLKTKNSKFTHIIHLADIHIRLTKRHDEYKEVFSRVYKKVEESEPTTLVCILGDIVHSKTDLTPECVQMVKDFLFNISNIRETILVAGNHDTNLSNKNRLDSLTPIVEALNHPNLHYLKKSGLYGIGDICFNNYSIFDTTDCYVLGKDIPQIYRNQYQHFISLFHGAVDNAITDIGFRIVNKSIPISLFDNHDIVLLGDIHMKQDLQQYDYHQNKPIVRYPSSLLQQNHGESLDGHGYSLWDLKSKSYIHVEIPNDYGYFTVVMDNGKIISNVSNIPKKAKIKFQLFETVATEVKSALSQLRLSSDITEVCYENIKDDSQIKNAHHNGNFSIGNILDRNYQINLLTEYLNKRLNITDSDFINKIIKINDDTNSLIKKDDFARNIRWIPIRFEWENMFSYGEGNVIDFTKVKDVVGLFALNASGKSSIFSSLSFCIFDKCEREFKAVNILNSQKTSFRCKFEFEIGGKRFFIERKGKSDRKGNVKVDVRFWTIENGIEKDLHGEDRHDTNEVIREYVGTYEDFILTSMSVQNGKNNGSVIDMGNTERKDLLAQFMGLSLFERLHTEANNRFKELAGLLKNFKSIDYTKNLTEYQNALSQAECVFSEESKQIESIQLDIGKTNDRILEISKELIKIDVDIPPIEDSNTKKELANKKLDSINKDIGALKSSFIDIESLTAPLTSEIESLEKKDIDLFFKNHQKYLAEKTDLESNLLRKKMEVDRNIEKVNREKNHAYNRTCKFCIDNSSTIIKDAEIAQEELDKDKIIVTQLLNTLKTVQSNINSTLWAAESQHKYIQLLSQKNRYLSEQFRINNQLNKLEADINICKNIIQESNKNIELFNKNKESIIKNEELTAKINSVKLELCNLETSIKIKNKKLVELNGKISVYKTEINTINKKISDAKSNEEEYKLYEVYTEAVNRDGIPFDVITVTVPRVEQEVNNILAQICNFHAKFETDGKNIIPYIVYEDNGKWLMTLTSGYEKFVLSLAIRVALINISNLPRPNFLIIDEGFGVLDSENLSSMQILFSYLKSNFEFVMVISHLEELRDMVDKQIEISKNNGFSKVYYD